MMPRPTLALVTPALADANNGNWQTARRWAAMLAGAFDVRLMREWRGGDEAGMLALHARRSADSVAAWRAARGPGAPLVLALTGTDLYRDIQHDASAQRSLALADRLIVLNELGTQALPAALRDKARVVLQSCPARQPLAHKPGRHLRAVAVGHLREEKDPRTLLRAAERLAGRTDIRIDHLGTALDPALGEAARATMARCPGYRWLGGVTHGQARRRIQAAHVLVHTSRMEGGAHVVIEALRSGTPVIASRIAGNLGLLGRDWPAVFEPGDDAGLATLLERVRDEPDMLPSLEQAAAHRAPLFTPEAERAALRAVLDPLLAAARKVPP